MKKLLLPLSCLLALSACWRHTREPSDWEPSRDIPAGTLVRVTLRDVSDPSRVSTYVVDPRAGRVVERLDGRRAQQDASGTVTAAQLSTSTVSTSVTLPCPEIKVEGSEEPICVVFASDPKLETSDDPNPVKELEQRLELTSRFVVQVAVNLLEAAHVTGVNVGVSGLKQAPTPAPAPAR